MLAIEHYRQCLSAHDGALPASTKGTRRFPPTSSETRKPLVLERFQVEILADHFWPAIELITVIPKKNHKTTTIGDGRWERLGSCGREDLRPAEPNRRRPDPLDPP